MALAVTWIKVKSFWLDTRLKMAENKPQKSKPDTEQLGYAEKWE